MTFSPSHKYLNLYVQQSRTGATKGLILYSSTPQVALFWKNPLAAWKTLGPWRLLPPPSCGEAQKFCQFKGQLPQRTGAQEEFCTSAIACWITLLQSASYPFFFQFLHCPILLLSLFSSLPVFTVGQRAGCPLWGPPVLCGSVCVAQTHLCVCGDVCHAWQQSGKGGRHCLVLQEGSFPLRS